MNYLGNKDILKLHKTAFLCSRKCPAEVVLKSFDWATEMKNSGRCVISGFHSQIEKDVLEILLRGSQPIIIVLARGMKKQWSKEIKFAINANRILIISPYKDNILHISQKNANKSNNVMLELADEIYLAYATENGNLEKLIKGIKDATNI